MVSRGHARPGSGGLGPERGRPRAVDARRMPLRRPARWNPEPGTRTRSRMPWPAWRRRWAVVSAQPPGRQPAPATAPRAPRLPSRPAASGTCSPGTDDAQAMSGDFLRLGDRPLNAALTQLSDGDDPADLAAAVQDLYRLVVVLSRYVDDISPWDQLARRLREQAQAGEAADRRLRSCCRGDRRSAVLVAGAVRRPDTPPRAGLLPGAR
jgi:hypothetical protein